MFGSRFKAKFVATIPEVNALTDRVAVNEEAKVEAARTATAPQSRIMPLHIRIDLFISGLVEQLRT